LQLFKRDYSIDRFARVDIEKSDRMWGPSRQEYYLEPLLTHQSLDSVKLTSCGLARHVGARPLAP
jgi:hypothetical protein